MNAEQKRAWFVLGMFGLACVGFVVWALTLGLRGAWGAFGVFGLAGFAFLIRQHERPDERDAAINRRAALVAGLASYMTFVTCCMAIWLVAFAWQRQEQVSVQMFVAVTVAGGIVFYLAHSVAILVLYGRHVEADHA
jgi:hypothetical protein